MILSEDYHFLLPVCFLLAIQLCPDADQKERSHRLQMLIAGAFGGQFPFSSLLSCGLSLLCPLLSLRGDIWMVFVTLWVFVLVPIYTLG